MMRKDNVTLELTGVPRRPGRPPKADALTHAERQRAYRARKAAEGKAEVPAFFLSSDVADALKTYVDRQNMDNGESEMTVGDAVDRILRAYLLRKR